MRMGDPEICKPIGQKVANDSRRKEGPPASMALSRESLCQKKEFGKGTWRETSGQSVVTKEN